jgi:hypothetical protein
MLAVCRTRPRLALEPVTTQSQKFPARALTNGDQVGSGETIVSVSAGVRTPRGKVEVTLEKDGRCRRALWSAHTIINGQEGCAMKHVMPPAGEIALADRLPTFHELASFDAKQSEPDERSLGAFEGHDDQSVSWKCANRSDRELDAAESGRRQASVKLASRRSNTTLRTGSLWFCVMLTRNPLSDLDPFRDLLAHWGAFPTGT